MHGEDLYEVGEKETTYVECVNDDGDLGEDMYEEVSNLGAANENFELNIGKATKLELNIGKVGKANISLRTYRRLGSNKANLLKGKATSQPVVVDVVHQEEGGIKTLGLIKIESSKGKILRIKTKTHKVK